MSRQEQEEKWQTHAQQEKQHKEHHAGGGAGAGAGGSGGAGDIHNSFTPQIGKSVMCVSRLPSPINWVCTL